MLKEYLFTEKKQSGSNECKGEEWGWGVNCDSSGVDSTNCFDSRCYLEGFHYRILKKLNYYAKTKFKSENGKKIRL